MGATEARVVPRRCDLLRNTPIELAIRDIVHDIEALGADPLLTDAVNFLHQAREKLADFIDQ